jgi:hypothetical protein
MLVDGPRVGRARQYELALQEWCVGGEWLALSHLWIAVENLTEAVLRRTKARAAASATSYDWPIEMPSVAVVPMGSLLSVSALTVAANAPAVLDGAARRRRAGCGSPPRPGPR